MPAENFDELIKKHSNKIPPVGVLMAEIVHRVGQIDQENLFSIVDQLVEKYGSLKTAITAVKTGEVQFGIEE